MKINPIIQQNVISAYHSKGFSKTGAATKPQSKLDEVSFSQEGMSFSKTIAGIRDKVGVEEPTEQSRLDDIKSRVNDGSYWVDSSIIAAKILGSVSPE